MPDASSDPASLAAAKAALRTHMRSLRRTFVKEHPEADWEAGDRAPELVAALGFRKPGLAAIYHASGSELDARPLAEGLIKLGWSLALPWCEEPDTAIIFRAWKPGDRLAPDAAGISAPLVGSPAVFPDLVVCPVLAFDAAGARLGQGGGYYDRTLEGLRKINPGLAVIGLAFSIQEIAAVPGGPHDQKIDAILTDKGYRRLP